MKSYVCYIPDEASSELHNVAKECYLKSEVDAVIAELKDRCQKHDFFWEGCGFSKMGFKNTIGVANYVEELKAKVDSLQRENQILNQYKLAAHSSYGIQTNVPKAEHEWHKVSDCKPPEDTRVLVLIDVLRKGVKFIQIDTYTREDGFASTRVPRFKTYGGYVTHWMPLPKEP